VRWKRPTRFASEWGGDLKVVNPSPLMREAAEVLERTRSIRAFREAIAMSVE
jgi:hypothetical protein